MLPDDDLIGLTIEEARTKAEEAGCIIRVASLNGEESYAVTTEYILHRINVHVDDGKVTGIKGRG